MLAGERGAGAGGTPAAVQHQDSGEIDSQAGNADPPPACPALSIADHQRLSGGRPDRAEAQHGALDGQRPRSGEQTQIPGFGDSLTPIVHAKLAVDIASMDLDRLGRNNDVLSDFQVG